MSGAFAQHTHAQLCAALEEHEAFVAFLFPRWGQKRFTLEAPDALQLTWNVWDNDAKRTFAMGESPLKAVTAARRRVNHEQCEVYAIKT